MSDRAVVLAGGKGTRLQPYSTVLPKPLMPIGEYPVLEVIIRQLVRHRFDHITLAVNHQAEIIKAFFGDGGRWDVRIDYSLESQPLSTIAPLRLLGDLPDDFLLMNGDVLTDCDLQQLVATHVAHKRLFTIAAAERRQVIDYGVLHVDGHNILTGFHEKPATEYLVSMGIYVVNKAILALIPPVGKYGFDDLMADLLAQGSPVHVERHNGYWLDIGRPDDYMQAIDEFEARKTQLLGHV
jgi:NDP-sugar pyrophosphorylase family protein